MKKIYLIFALLISLCMASCGSKANIKDVEKKIEANQTLDKADYECMLDYAIDLLNSGKDLASLNEKDVDRFSTVVLEIYAMPDEYKNDKNIKKKFNELSKKMEGLKSMEMSGEEETWTVSDDDEDTMVEVEVVCDEVGDEPIGY